jgi:hypothetical protein
MGFDELAENFLGHAAYLIGGYPLRAAGFQAG